MDLSLNMKGFSATAEADPERLSLRLTGVADLVVKDALHDYPDRIHEHAISLGVPEVLVDLRKLDFMSSGCFRVLTRLVFLASKAPPTGRYKIVVLLDVKLLWQRRSLAPLSALAPDVLTIGSVVADGAQ